MVGTAALFFSVVAWWYLIRQYRLEREQIGFGFGLALVYFLVLASRPVAFWFHASSSDLADADIAAGNPLNRYISLALMALAVLTLVSRRTDLRNIVAANKLLICLFVYAGLSIVWSDFPFVAYKRWVRHLGPLLFVLVVLTDRRGFAAVVNLVRYAAYILVPTSIILIKWYPSLGRHYHMHSGELMITGVTMNKNTLGMICLIFAVFLFSEIHQQWSSGNRRGFRLKGDLCLFAATGYLLWKSHSATSMFAFLGGVLLYSALGFGRVQRVANPRVVVVVVLLLALGIPIASVSLSNSFASLVDLTGHADTFWGRTVLWKVLIDLAPNPLLGCGYDSFWLGDRLAQLWDLYWWAPTEAHNGFVEVYLQLGLVGIAILMALIFQTYGRLYRLFTEDAEFARLKLALLISILLYNVTEAAFEGLSPVWFIFLLISVRVASAVVPELEDVPEHSRAFS